MSKLREVAYRDRSGAVGARGPRRRTRRLGRRQFLRAPRGASHSGVDRAAGRQDHDRRVGDCACHGVHAGIVVGDSLSGATAECGSGAAGARILLKVGAKLKSDNVYGLELDNGSRVLALPGSDDSIRGLTVDGWIVADEAARLPEDMIAALRPMRARRPQARFAMLSTAWSRTDPFWTAWSERDPTWIRLKATADTEPTLFTGRNILEQERRALGEARFQSRISRHSGRRRSQSVHLGVVRARDRNPRAVGAARSSFWAAARAAGRAAEKPIQRSATCRRTSDDHVQSR